MDKQFTKVLERLGRSTRDSGISERFSSTGDTILADTGFSERSISIGESLLTGESRSENCGSSGRPLSTENCGSSGRPLSTENCGLSERSFSTGVLLLISGDIVGGIMLHSVKSIMCVLCSCFLISFTKLLTF